MTIHKFRSDNGGVLNLMLQTITTTPYSTAFRFAASNSQVFLILLQHISLSELANVSLGDSGNLYEQPKSDVIQETLIHRQSHPTLDFPKSHSILILILQANPHDTHTL